MKKLFCRLGIHFWQISKEKHKVIDHPGGRNNTYVKVRTCSGCGKRQHHMMPAQNGQPYLWKDCKFGPTDTIKFQKFEP